MVVVGRQLVHDAGLAAGVDPLAENPALARQVRHAVSVQTQLAGEFAEGQVAFGAQLSLAALQMSLHADAIA